jgi:hypothetical protein
METIERSTSVAQECPCGCGQQSRVLSGKFNYEPDQHVAFRTILLKCSENGPHVWSLLETGQWFDDDNRNCCVTLHTWVQNDNLVTRVEDFGESPLVKLFEFSERLLTREEVLSHPGGKEWAFKVHDKLEIEHNEISTFILSLVSI